MFLDWGSGYIGVFNLMKFIKLYLEDIKLSEVSQAQKVKHCMIPLIGLILRVVKFRETRCPGPGRVGWDVSLMGIGFHFWKMKNF